MTPALELRGVDVELGGVPVLHGIDLAVPPGELLALVGPNGAGKSTLLGCLSGDVAPRRGSVRVEGTELGRWPLSDLARVRAVLPQEHHLAFGFPVREVVEMGRAPWRRLPEEHEDEVAVEEALATVDVTHLADRSFTSLSGGEKARAAFARVLAQRARILLLDEPTAALDIAHQEALLGTARAVADRGRTVVAVLHDLTLAAAYADRVAVVCAGNLHAVGAPDRVLTGDLLSEVYGHPVDVFDHPQTGELVIMPRRRTREVSAR
jgi:iron complex transport system ATP-binding protein